MPTKRNNSEGNIRQHLDGRWEARYTVGNNPGTCKPLRRFIYGGPVEKNGKAMQNMV